MHNKQIAKLKNGEITHIQVSTKIDLATRKDLKLISALKDIPTGTVLSQAISLGLAIMKKEIKDEVEQW